MRVLLVIPGFEELYGAYRHLYRKGFLNPPISLCYIAAALERASHEVKIIDGEAERLSSKRIIEIARGYKAGLFGVTATSIDFHKTRLLCKELKGEFPETPIIIGGVHINIFGKQVLSEMPEADFGCIGDGEDLIVELTDLISSGTMKNLSQIKGLIFRDGKEIAQNSPRPLENNLDRYTFPARHLLNNELYSRLVPYRGFQVTASLMSTRGCPYSCIYCAVKNIYGGQKVRIRSAQNVFEEIDRVVNKMRVKHIAFNDDCLTIDKDRIYEICAMIRKSGLKFTWEGLSRADLVDKELLREMKESGFVRVSYGIESGNPEILKMLQKNETLEQIRRAFKITKEVGVVARGSVIIGCPYENSGTVQDTFRFIRGLEGLNEVVINILQPYPGTRVREMVLSGEGGATLCQDEGNYNGLQRFGSATVKVNDLDPEKLIRLQKKGFLIFYLRPGIMWNSLRMMGVKYFFQSAINFLRTIFDLRKKEVGYRK